MAIITYEPGTIEKILDALTPVKYCIALGVLVGSHEYMRGRSGLPELVRAEISGVYIQPQRKELDFKALSGYNEIKYEMIRMMVHQSQRNTRMSAVGLVIHLGCNSVSREDSKFHELKKKWTNHDGGNIALMGNQYGKEVLVWG